VRCEGIEEAVMLLKCGDLMLKEAATLKRQGNIIKAQGYGLMARAVGDCDVKPDNITDETWEIFRCSQN
jgi:hypothetical protein